MVDTLLDYLIFGLVLLGFLAFNYLNARRAQRERAEPTVPTPTPPNTDAIEDDPHAWGRSPVAEPTLVPWALAAVRLESPPAVRETPPSGSNDRAARIRRQLAGARGLQDAVVLMTVLGPCVANQDRKSHATSTPSALG